MAELRGLLFRSGICIDAPLVSEASRCSTKGKAMQRHRHRYRQDKLPVELLVPARWGNRHSISGFSTTIFTHLPPSR